MLQRFADALWTVHFLFLVLTLVPWDLELPSGRDLASHILFALAVVGLWGFITSKRIINRWVWLCVALVGIGDTVWTLFGIIAEHPEDTKFAVILSLMFAPLYYGLFRYFLSDQWQDNNITSH